MSAVDIHSGPIGEVRLASASKGAALTTTATFTSFPTGTNYLTLQPRNAATAVVVRYALNPYLVIIKTTDSLAAVANLTVASETLQDNDTATELSISQLDTIANGDALYIGAHTPFRGAGVIMGSTTNDTASVLTVKYRKSDDTWADISATDGTDVGGDTLKQTGEVTWTLPTDWIARSLVDIGDTSLTAPAELRESALFWTRWEVSVQIDADVTVTGMQSMNRSTSYGEFLVNTGKEFRIYKGIGGIGCIEHLTDAGTANLLVEAAVLGVAGKFKD